jgi:hypothetical protein
MKRLGFLLITIGFLAACYATVLDPTEVAWGLFVPTTLVAVLGVVLVRIGTRRIAFHADTVASNIDDIETSLTRIAGTVAMLNREKGTIHTYDMRHQIDELLTDDLNTFVDARETIATQYGLHAYADVMSHFAAGERYLNRVWSCSADGYIDEVNAYLERAEEQFNDTLARFQGLQGGEAAQT